MTMDWLWDVDQGFERQAKSNARSISFGDGYEQRGANGINTVKETVTIRCGNRPVAEIRNMDALLRSLNGVESFNFYGADGFARRYICREWSITENNGVFASLSATFIQVFEY